MSADVIRITNATARDLTVGLKTMNMTASKITFVIITLLRTPDFTASTKSDTLNLVAEPIAYITHISGVVMVKPAIASRPKSIDSTTFLYENDEVSVGKAGSALLVQVNALAERLGENEKRTIKPIAPPPPNRACTREQFTLFKKSYQRSEENRKRKPPARRKKRRFITALTLRFGLLLDPRPILAWTPVTGAKSYIVRLFDNQNNIIWSKTTPDSRVSSETPTLNSGEYRWDVTARTTSGRILYDGTPFTAISQEQAEKIRDELQLAREVTENIDGVNLIYVATCLHYQQYRSGEEELKRGLRRSPSDKVLWTLLAETYWAMQRWDDREMALKFRSNPTPTEKLQSFLTDKNAQ